MAEVYRATLVGAEGFSRPVAIKLMLPGLSAEPDFERMFLNEARLAALLNHPNVVSVIDFDRDSEGRLFLVMEMVDGIDLRHLMDAGRLPISVSAYIMAKLLEALSYAHQVQHEGRPLGLVHRDVTPHNLLLSTDGHVKLSDFGIAKAVERTSVTRTGMLKGKVSYMSPEQIEGEPLDGRSDLFTAGIVFWEMLTGRSLFRGDPATDRVVLNRILIAPIEAPTQVAPDVPEPLSLFCMRLLERERDDRYRDAQAALTDLLDTGLVSPGGPLDLKAQLKALPQREAPSPGTAPVPADRSDTRQWSPLAADTTPSASWSAPTKADETAAVAPHAATRPSTSHFDGAELQVERPSRLRFATAVLALLALGLGATLWVRQSPSAEVLALPEAPAPHIAEQIAVPIAPVERVAEPALTPKPQKTTRARPKSKVPTRNRVEAQVAPTLQPKVEPPKIEPVPKAAAPTAQPGPKPAAPVPALAPAAPLGDGILAPSFDDD